MRKSYVSATAVSATALLLIALVIFFSKTEAAASDERVIIHMVLQDIDRVATLSCVVVDQAQKEYK